MPTRRHVLGLAAALGLTACAAPAPATPAAVDGVDPLIDWIAAHPDQASLLVDDGRGGSAAHLADRPRPVASAVKVVHLLAYAAAVGDGRLDPAAPVAVRDWERWYVPGADGGRTRGALRALGTTADGATTWDGITSAMLGFSDNAAADLLVEALGEDALRAAAAGAGWTPFDVPHLAGEGLFALAPDPTADRRAAARTLGAAYAAGEPTARALGAQYAARNADPDALLARWDADVAVWDSSWSATAAQLVAAHRTAAADGQSAFVRAGLERLPPDRLPAGVLGVGQKGGSLPGVLSWAGSVRRADGTTGVGAVLLTRLPLDVWAQALTSEAVTRLGQQALLDPAVTERVRRAGG